MCSLVAHTVHGVHTAHTVNSQLTLHFTALHNVHTHTTHCAHTLNRLLHGIEASERKTALQLCLGYNATSSIHQLAVDTCVVPADNSLQLAQQALVSISSAHQVCVTRLNVFFECKYPAY
jgi:hypothetical protein